jgi:hypothetical protein
MRRLTVLGLASTAALFLAGTAAPALAQQPTGSFQASCRDVAVANGSLSAYCTDMRGQGHTSSIPYRQCRGDIGNNNGLLACNGARATEYFPNQGSPGYGHDDRRGYSGSGYGDHGFGYGWPVIGVPPDQGYFSDDRRGDSTYPQFAWLEDHIRDGIRDGIHSGQLSRDDAHAYFGQLRDIQDREQRYYQRYGANLPYDASQRIKGQLRDLDRQVGGASGR